MRKGLNAPAFSSQQPPAVFLGSAQHGAFPEKPKFVSKALGKKTVEPPFRFCEARHTPHGNLSVATKKMDRQFPIQTAKRWRHLQIDEK